MAAPSDLCLKLRVSFSIIGILVGVSILFVFGLRFTNWNAAVWGLMSGLAASLTLYVHLQYMRNTWQTFPYRLRYFMLAGCFIQLMGVCGFVAYLTLAITQHQVLTGYHDGFYVTCVWCFMTWKWGFALFYYSRSYRRLYCDIYTILPQDPKDDVQPGYSGTE